MSGRYPSHVFTTKTTRASEQPLTLLTQADMPEALPPGSPSEVTAGPKYLDVPHGVRDEIAFHDEQRVVGQWIEDHLRVVEHLYVPVALRAEPHHSKAAKEQRIASDPTTSDNGNPPTA